MLELSVIFQCVLENQSMIQTFAVEMAFVPTSNSVNAGTVGLVKSVILPYAMESRQHSSKSAISTMEPVCHQINVSVILDTLDSIVAYRFVSVLLEMQQILVTVEEPVGNPMNVLVTKGI
jgi:hypothetical protein